eukprot:5349982-Amphidinium_carterae.1
MSQPVKKTTALAIAMFDTYAFVHYLLWSERNLGSNQWSIAPLATGGCGLGKGESVKGNREHGPDIFRLQRAFGSSVFFCNPPYRKQTTTRSIDLQIRSNWKFDNVHCQKNA